jgi:hypothetical protein
MTAHQNMNEPIAVISVWIIKTVMAASGFSSFQSRASYGPAYFKKVLQLEDFNEIIVVSL